MKTRGFQWTNSKTKTMVKNKSNIVFRACEAAVSCTRLRKDRCRKLFQLTLYEMGALITVVTKSLQQVTKTNRKHRR